MTGFLDLPAELYHADSIDNDRPSLNAGIASILITQSPAHARAAHPRLNPDYERRDEIKFNLGRAAHALFLEGRAAVDVIEMADWRTKDAQAMRDEALANGRIPLLADQWTDVQAMCAAVREQLPLFDVDPPLFEDGTPERTIVWDEDGVLCRARLDWLHDNNVAIDDLKTTSRSAHPDSWGKTMFGMGAHIQAAFYRRGVGALTGIRPDFRFVVAEVYPPYQVSVVTLAPSALAVADAQVDYAINMWRNCLECDAWPGYPRKVAHVEIPSWLEFQWLEREEAA